MTYICLWLELYTNNGQIRAQLFSDFTVSTIADTSDVLIPTLITLKVTPEKLRKKLEQLSNVKLEISEPKASKPKASPKRYPKGHWDNTTYRLKFGWTPFPEHAGPDAALVRVVHDVLEKHHHKVDDWQSPLGDPIYTEGQAHGTGSKQLDTSIRAIVGQATSNLKASLAQERMIEEFQYKVNGGKAKGKIPDFHQLRLCNVKKLEDIVSCSGLQERKVGYIRNLLNQVFEHNKTMRKLGPEVVKSTNERNAPEFVPGMLSLDFMAGWKKREILNWFLAIKGIGVKTTCCILEMGFSFAVCAVDTHVFNMAHYLGWAPWDADTPDKVFMHLDWCLPDYYKHAIHQSLWQHMQTCSRCRTSRNRPLKSGETPCVLEQYIVKRDTPRRKRSYARGKDAEDRGPPKHMAFEKLTAEAAAHMGYFLLTNVVEDAFGGLSKNRIVVKQWVLTSWYHEDVPEVAEEEDSGLEE